MKRLSAFLLILLLLFAVGCQHLRTPEGSRETAGESTVPLTEETPAPETEPTEEPKLQLEALQTSVGRHAVSDGECLYFTIHSADETQGLWKEGDGLFRTGLQLEDPVLLAHGNCHSLVLDGETLYFILEDAAGRWAICATDRTGTELRRILTDVEGADSLGLCGGKLFFVQDGALCIVEDTETGEIRRVVPTYSAMQRTARVLLAQPSTDDRIWISALCGDYCMLYLYDPAEESPWAVADLTGDFAITTNGVYYFITVPDQPAYEDLRQLNLALMKMDVIGEPVFTGIEGRFDGEILAYGQYLLYTKYMEVEEKAGKGEYTVRKLFCYDTKTGVETLLPLDETLGFDVTLRGVTAGRVFLNRWDYYGTDPESVEFCDCLSCDLTGDGPDESLSALLPFAVPSQASLADDLAVAEFIEAREREKEEELRNTPYGPGTSFLYLSAGSGSACYRLVRMDGTTQFMVLLAPGEDRTMSFPCGKYILKTAYGETWISDEEAFGPDGRYSATNPFDFEANATYEISVGSTGSFHGDNQSGFTGS